MRNISRKDSFLKKRTLYGLIKNKSEDIFIDCYFDESYLLIEDCINESIDYYWDEILESKDYEDIDEKLLEELLLNELLYDLDENEIISEIEDNYYI